MTVKKLLAFSPSVMWYKFEDLNGYVFYLHRNGTFMCKILDIEVLEIGTDRGSIYVKLSEAIK